MRAWPVAELALDCSSTAYLLAGARAATLTASTIGLRAQRVDVVPALLG